MRSRIETIPTTFPSSTTGRCRKPPWIMSAAACPVASEASIVSGCLVIHSRTRVLGEPRRDRLEDIALGEDPLEGVAVHDEHGPDPAPDHAPHGLGHRSSGPMISRSRDM